MQQPIFSIQVVHLGKYADGRPNNQSILITDINYDLDVAATRMPRYLPAGGLLDLPLTSRVMGSYVQGDISKLVAAGMVRVDITSPGQGLENLSVVDSSSTATQENGTWDFPWKSIQKALNALWGSPSDVSPAPPPVEAERKTILVMSGTYDENIVFPAAGNIALLSFGVVRIGTATTPRSVTRIVDLSVTPGPPGSATVTSIGSLFGSAASSAALSISGDIVLGNINGVRVQNFLLESVSHAGNFNAAAQTAGLNLAMTNCLLASPVFNAPTATAILSRVRFFGGTPILKTLSGTIDTCEFATGFNISTLPTSSMILTGTKVAGTVTAPAGSFRVDYTTNGYFDLNAVVKVGAWTTDPIGRTLAY